MKISTFRSAVMVAVMVGVFALAAKAQVDPIAGGYSNISVRSKEARNTAAVAVKQHSANSRDKVSLVKVLKAEQQVVAGMNYRVCLLVKNRRGMRHTITAVVFRPLRGSKRLTSWEAGGCREI